MPLETQDQALDTVEVCDLEYDVASIGSAEASVSEGKQAIYIIFYKLPERG